MGIVGLGRVMRRMIIAGAIVCGAASLESRAVPQAVGVNAIRVPASGIQPQIAVDASGSVHLIYFSGDAAHGDLFYVRMDRPGQFTAPLQVNSQPGSALATGSVRGGQIAVGRNGRVHVAWHGSDRSGGAAAVQYARINDSRTAFEPERNLAQFTTGIDGSAVAADGSGHVYVVWHGGAPGVTDEGGRRVWIARSTDDGVTFRREAPASDASTGACGCCGVGALADRSGNLYVLYRSAREIVHRDTFLLTSLDTGAKFSSVKLQEWNLGACPMSTFSLAESAKAVLAAWETDGQVYWVDIDRASGRISKLTAAPGSTRDRKHPVVARNARGQTLLAWTEGTGWNKGGAVAWQVFNEDGAAVGEPGRRPGVPAWGLVAVAPLADGTFVLIY